MITGSSAGALNAALAARCLAVNRNLLPWIEKAWVDAADASEVVLVAHDWGAALAWQFTHEAVLQASAGTQSSSMEQVVRKRRF